MESHQKHLSNLEIRWRPATVLMHHHRLYLKINDRSLEASQVYRDLISIHLFSLFRALALFLSCLHLWVENYPTQQQHNHCLWGCLSWLSCFLLPVSKVNFIQFISIIRILVQKLRCPDVGGNDQSQYRYLTACLSWNPHRCLLQYILHVCVFFFAKCW